ncbi:MAG: hypothetical protein ACJ8AD_03155 [Gemmatimonadaceae bacterium]
MKKFLAVAFAAAVLALSPAAEAFTYSATVKTNRMTAVRDTWGASAKLKIYHSDGTTVCATFTLSATTADSTISGSVLTIKFTGNSASQTVSASAACTATSAKITTSADVDVITSFTVGTSGSDINLNNTSITSGQSVSITAASLTHN